MKNIIILFFLFILTFGFSSCRGSDDVNGKSIFEDVPEEEFNSFDKWLYSNFVYPYNIEILYKWKDSETSKTNEITPASLENSIKLAKLVKHVWIEAYTEEAGVLFVKKMAPKILMFIGSGSWNSNGSVTLGTAEGGLKVTLYDVNNLTLSAASLNSRYFKTMHHEFGHILNQTIPFSNEFQRITESLYVGSEWTNSTFQSEALSLGFVTHYSRFSPEEDFVELASLYVTTTQEYWDSLLSSAGADGKAIIEQKFDYVYNYYLDKWNIDLTSLREIVQRRTDEAIQMDLTLP